MTTGYGYIHTSCKDHTWSYIHKSIYFFKGRIMYWLTYQSCFRRNSNILGTNNLSAQHLTNHKSSEKSKNPEKSFKILGFLLWEDIRPCSFRNHSVSIFKIPSPEGNPKILKNLQRILQFLLWEYIGPWNFKNEPTTTYNFPKAE